jgi:hypothetical protein
MGRINTLSLYSRGPGFSFWTADPLSRLNSFVLLFNPFRQMPRYWDKTASFYMISTLLFTIDLLYSPPTSAVVKNTWIYISIPPYAFVA